MRKFLFLIAVLSMSFAAYANSISYTDSITGLFDQVPNRDLAVQQFDPLLGNLNSVTIDFSTAIQGDLLFENLVKYTGGTFQINTQVGAMVSLGAVMSSYMGSSTGYAVTVAKYDGVLDFAGTSGTTVASFSDADNATVTLISGLDAFIGTGLTAPFPLMTDSMSTIGIPHNSAACVNTTASASVTVTYNYTPPIPEPATMSILALGGLLFRRK